MHVNKALYTFSYMCVTAGAAGFLFAGLYLMVGISNSSHTVATILLESFKHKYIHICGLCIDRWTCMDTDAQLSSWSGWGSMP